MKRKIGFDMLIPVIAASVFILLNLLPFFQNAEHRVYDLLLRIKPSVPEEKAILFLDIDDASIEQVGMFPWSRDIMAEGLILMKEFEAAYAVFDIEYTEKSPLGVNAAVLNEDIPESFITEFSTINQNISDLFRALQAKQISLKDAGNFVDELMEITLVSRDILLDRVQDIARDNDTFFGQAASLFGKAYFTVNMLSEAEDAVSGQLKNYTYEEIALKNIRVESGFPFTVPDIRPAIYPILKGGNGAGFPNIVIDEDGVQRRIDLIIEFSGKYFAQLSFSALLDWLGNPAVSVSRTALKLKDASFPDGTKKDIVIPLTEDRRLLINWIDKKYLDSFRHMSFYALVQHGRLEQNLIRRLKIMEEAGYLSYHQGDFELLEPYRYAESIKDELLAGGEAGLINEYRQEREIFFSELGNFFTGSAEETLIGQIDTLLASEEVPEERKQSYREIRKEVPEVFGAAGQTYRDLLETRSRLKETLPGSFCIIGWIGTSTTDIGVNPFEKEYMNVGTHAALVNTILSGMFLDDLPWWYAAVLSMAFCLLITVIIRNLRPLPSLLIGAGFLLMLAAGGVAFFLFTGIYLNLLTPLLSVFVSLLSLILFKFLILEKEKSFLRNAFSHYLSTDVINELISDPEKLNLGGEKKHLTAIFTDVRGFSSISESLDPTDLVKLLNAYLTEMSNIILDQKGTIDKYEGDAIISFFGAPVAFSDHAARACLSAVRMKKMEKRLNEHFLNKKLSPTPLVTRIGINTGEMVVGNMGTSQKMDYTIMGNSVNLAARLEGVNKQYGTWTLISENTYSECGTDFTVRKLDRVRVVGIQTPVRLYELVDEKNETPENIKEAMEVFHHGLEQFESQNWNKADELFQQVQEIIPSDGPAGVYITRCKTYKRKAPAASWDGVFNLTVK
jgi:adenylate cyclase